MAWQLGGAEAYARVAADDEHATSPGDRVRELLVEYGPCLVLIDEWVAYARQLHDRGDLPAGSFETQFTFAQTLTESVKAVDNCLLVISLPASEPDGSPHTYADDAEVGGQRGRDALQRLRNVIGRVEAPWRPASAEESFGIVRRRLFQTFVDAAQFTARDVVARGSPTCTARSSRSSRPSAVKPTTRNGSRTPIRSIPRYSIGSTPTGPRWPSFSAPAACCV